MNKKLHSYFLLLSIQDRFEDQYLSIQYNINKIY